MALRSSPDSNTYPHDYRLICAGRETPTVVGGQAVNLWAISYLEPSAGDLRSSAYGSKDLDILADKKVVEYLKTVPGWDFTPNSIRNFAGLRERLAAAGVNWHLGTGVKAVDGQGDALRITLDNGAVLTVDLVLSATGLRPNCALAQATGIKTNCGIVVDRHLQTTAPDVYALGDCAEVEGLVLPFIMPITHAARALAATLAGKPTPLTYPAMPVLVKTHACPTIVSPPASGSIGEWQVTQEPDAVKSLFVDPSGRLLGYALNGKATAERAKLTAQLPPVLA